MKSPYGELPLIKIFIPFILGIILFLEFREASLFVTALAIIAFLSYWATSFVKKPEKSYQLRHTKGISIVVLIFAFGFLTTYVNTQILQSSHFTKVFSTNEKEYFVATIDEPVQKTAKSLKTILRVQLIQHFGETIPCNGRFICYFLNDSSAADLQYGDRLFIYTLPVPLQGPSNPHEFDYRKYLENQQIHAQIFLKKSDYSLMAEPSGLSVLRKIYQVRNYFSHLLDIYINDPQHSGVAKAILIGQREYLDHELIQAYAGSGAMHVLAVSGLHVGILFLIMNYALSFLNGSRKGRILKAVLLTFGIWFYACISGLSPSVQRAATMFTFIIAGQTLLRYVNIYNIILASATFLLIIDPYIYTAAGFKLSYLAVLGIIYLQPKLYGLLSFNSWLPDKIWALTTVSVAAQIATFPIGLFYFHQFPVLFFISNLFVIPLATFILYAGVALFIFSPVPFFGKLIGGLLEFFLMTMNKSVMVTQKMSVFSIENINISLFETGLIYFMIIFLTLLIQFRRALFMQIAITCAILLVVSNTLEDFKLEKQNKLIIYKAGYQSAIDLFIGTNNYTIIDQKLSDQTNKMSFHIDPNRAVHDIHKTIKLNNANFQSADITKKGSYILMHDQSIAIIDSALPKQKPPTPLHINYLILKNNPKIYIDQLLAFYSFDQLIFDGSNPNWKVKLWMKDCEKEGLKCHAVGLDKAFVASW